MKIKTRKSSNHSFKQLFKGHIWQIYYFKYFSRFSKLYFSAYI